MPFDTAGMPPDPPPKRLPLGQSALIQMAIVVALWNVLIIVVGALGEALAAILTRTMGAP